MNTKQLKLCVVGTGYVGLTTGVCLAVVGHHVTCIDINSSKIEMLRKGISPIYEPGMEELLETAKDRLTFVETYDACKDADVIFLAVGTPPTAAGKADMTYVEQATAQIAKQLSDEKLQVIVNKSTVPLGTGERTKLLISTATKQENKAVNFTVVSNPEFLREGLAIQDSLYPDRIVVGSENAEAERIMRDVYHPILAQSFFEPAVCKRPSDHQQPAFVSTDIVSAEMIKYAANAFLATKISFINEICGICEKMGADVTQVAHGIGLDKRIGSRFLQAGVGWGGSCFAKDTAALVGTGSEYNYEFPIISAAIAVNKRQRFRVIEKLQDTLKILRGRTIGILGLAFKPDTDDLRDAPSLDIIRWLIELGARVKVYDPIAMDNCRKLYPDLYVEYQNNPAAAAEQCAALVLITEWQEFKQMDLQQIAAHMVDEKILIDGRNVIDPMAAKKAGFIYCGFGRF